ncbi:MAG: DUF481 domain-containing protein [Sphingomonadaceae bacterium]
MRKQGKGVCLAALAPFVLAAPATAQESSLPPPVRAMVVTAAESGDKAKLEAVVAVAKETNPDAAEEIDRLVAAIAAQQEAQRIEALQTAGFLDNWKGRVSVGGALATGNTDTKNLALGINMVRDGLSWRHRLEANADIQRSAGTTDQERLLAAWQSDWKLSDALYVYGRFGYERNFDAGIARRFIESAGMGWSALRRPRMTWDLEAGPALQQTKYFDGRTEDGFAFRGASRFGWDLTPTTRLTNDTFLLANGASALNNTLAISTRLWRALSVGVSFTLLWEAEPAEDLRSTSTVSRFTIGYDF